MKLSVSNIAWNDEHNEEMYDFLAENGFSGIEIAPTKIVPAPAYENIDGGRKFAERMRSDFGLKIASMQSIWFGRKERIFGDGSERAFLLDYTMKAIDFAHALDCHNLVFGCPYNRRRDGADESAAMDFFREIGRYAEKNNTVFALEPNPEIYNTDYINTTEQAVQLAEKLDCRGIGINYDFGSVKYNREKVEDFPAELVNHVHISEPYLAPVEKCEEHKRLAEILAKCGYKGYVSVEMKDCGDIELLKSVLKYIKDVFS